MAEFRIRPREDWLDPSGPPWDHTLNGKGEFYVCPPFRGWAAINTVVIHYPGADWPDMDVNNDGRVDELDTVTLLRSGHRMYLLGADRGYSYGYGFKVGTAGDIWEIRGYDYANAANLGDAAHGTNPPPWNNSTISIQIVVDEAKQANALQVAATNWLLDDMRRRAGKELALSFHRHGQYTACPGDGIVGQITNNTIGFGKSKPPTPPEDDGMRVTLFRPKDCTAQFIGPATEDGVAVYLSWVDKARADAHIAAGATINDDLTLGGFTNCILLGPLPTGDTKHTWTGREFFRHVS